MLYPGMGLMEGIHVNEGRGTNTPFKLFGAPWIDAGLLLKEFKKLSLPGIQADEVCFTPETSLYQAESCNGLRFTISDKESFKPVMTGLELIRLIQNLFPGKCEERLYKTVANPSGKNHLDKLTGVQNAFEKIKNGVCRETHYSTGNWKETIKPFLLY